MTEPTLLVYADGSCLGNPGPGGYAWRIVRKADNAVLSEASKGFPEDTTNNRMELEGLRAVLVAILVDDQIQPCTIALRLDSQYALKGLFEWLPGWKAKSFHKIANDDLWVAIDTLYGQLVARGFTLTPAWVKGHAADVHNNAVDAAAVQASTAAKASRTAAANTVAQPTAEAVAPVAVETVAESSTSDAPHLPPIPTSAAPRTDLPTSVAPSLPLVFEPVVAQPTTPVAPAPVAPASNGADALAAARTLLLVARDAGTTPEAFLVELRAMAARLGLSPL
jgi:ribonuclease HI